MIETAATAAIGATVSIMDSGGATYVKLCRMWFVGFFLAVFAGNDVVNLMQHFFSFHVSKGGTVFMVALFGSAIVERVLFFIRSFKLSTIGYKK